MSRVFSVQFTPGQDNEFLSGGWDDTVQVTQILNDPARKAISISSQDMPEIN